VTKKGMSGKILTFIISLILGLLALALLWIFLTKSTTLISASVQKVIEGMKCKIFCHRIIGIKVGMCSGC